MICLHINHGALCVRIFSGHAPVPPENLIPLPQAHRIPLRVVLIR